MPPTVDELTRGVLAGDRVLLAQAITLIESRRDEDRGAADELLRVLAPHSGGAIRIGLSGLPGAGKSTLIETLGMRLVESGRRVAVLAVDPSSTLSGGSILGDKSRMPDLSRSPAAFVRPSPSAATLGGVARRTREALVACEAAGYDVVFVETVGVGQSETAVSEMVDIFIVLLLPGAGDELQGIKKGLLELADVVCVNKADGEREREALAREAVRDVSAALRLARSRSPHWRPRVIAISAVEGTGLDELWSLIEEHRQAFVDADALDERRLAQRERWMWSIVEERLLDSFRDHPGVRARLAAVAGAVRGGLTSPEQAAGELLREFLDSP